MKGLYLAVLQTRATGFLTDHNLLEHLYVLHLELHHCIPPPLNLCHPPPQWLSPPLSAEKEDAWLISAVLFRDPTPLSWLDVYKRADPEPYMDARYLTHEEPVALPLSRLQCQLLPLSSQHVPPISPFPGSLPPPTAANLDGHLLVDTGRWGWCVTQAWAQFLSDAVGISDRSVVTQLSRFLLSPKMILLSERLTPCICTKNTCWGLAGTAWAWKPGYHLCLSDASPHQHKSQGDLVEEVPMAGDLVEEVPMGGDCTRPLLPCPPPPCSPPLPFCSWNNPSHPILTSCLVYTQSNQQLNQQARPVITILVAGLHSVWAPLGGKLQELGRLLPPFPQRGPDLDRTVSVGTGVQRLIVVSLGWAWSALPHSVRAVPAYCLWKANANALNEVLQLFLREHILSSKN